MGKNKFLTIIEVAQELGISKQTLLRYEKKGIFPKARRHPVNKWRIYTLKDVEYLRRILYKEEG